MSRSVKKSWTLFGALLGVGATLASVIGLGVFTGDGTAASTAAPVNTSPPTITGTPQEGQNLTGNKGVWSGNPSGYDYFWTRCDKSGGSCANISSASSTTYTLTSTDVGNTVRFKVKAKNADGNTSASSVPTAVIIAATKPAPPVNTSPPTITGTPQEGQNLTGGKGVWSGNPTGYNYFWTRCDKSGAGCSNISGASSTTYTLTLTDVGNTVRFKVEAKNANGSTFARSGRTEVISAATKPPPPPGTAISVDKVSLPNRLVVDKVSFSPNPTRSHGPIVARFHVSDTRGYAIQGALVYALGLPYSWVGNAPEVPTDSSGWATITLQPTSAMPLQRGGALVIFVRARKPGDNLLAGVSTRRLVQEGISR